MNELIQVLEKTKKYIEKGFAKGGFAKDANGGQVGIDNPRACSWCLSGALYAAVLEIKRNEDYKIRANLLDKVSDLFKDEIKEKTIPIWNDLPETTQELVLSVIQNKIQQLTTKDMQEPAQETHRTAHDKKVSTRSKRKLK